MKWKYIPAADSSVDAEYQLLYDNGDDTGISIQDGGTSPGRFSVNEHGGESAGYWMKIHQVCDTLKAAKEKAMMVFSENNVE